MRSSGVLMHITSLPSPGGIGTLGQEAYEFADFLQASGFRIWQVLPVGPVGYGESPYQSSSIFAGNPLLISCRTLRDEHLLSYGDEEEYVPEDPEKVDYESVRKNKMMLLRRCYEQSADQLGHQLNVFRADHPWVSDFALYTAVKEHFGGIMFSSWPDREIIRRTPEAIRKYSELLKDEVSFHIFCQFLFRRQWISLREYCGSRGILLFGDMPIYVAEDSADTWTHPEIFQLDRNRIPKRVAGVPPDYFSELGQLWGNPLYRWTYLRFRRYDWWVGRMKAMADMYDMVRIDHFIGFANYYSIPHGAPDARKGRYVIGPGKNLFRVLKKEVPGVRIVAEDLGTALGKAFKELPGFRSRLRIRALESLRGKRQRSAQGESSAAKNQRLHVRRRRHRRREERRRELKRQRSDGYALQESAATRLGLDLRHAFHLKMIELPVAENCSNSSGWSTFEENRISSIHPSKPPVVGNLPK